MNVNKTLTGAVGDWVSMLMAAERTADAMRSEIDEQFDLLDKYDAHAAEPTQLQQAQLAMSARLADVNQRFQAAQHFANEVSEQLNAAESEFRQWTSQLSVLHNQLAAVSAL